MLISAHHVSTSFIIISDEGDGSDASQEVSSSIHKQPSSIILHLFPLNLLHPSPSAPQLQECRETHRDRLVLLDPPPSVVVGADVCIEMLASDESASVEKDPSKDVLRVNKGVSVNLNWISNLWDALRTRRARDQR